MSARLSIGFRERCEFTDSSVFFVHLKSIYLKITLKVKLESNMTIEIDVIDGITYDVDLECNAESSDNGTEYSYLGEEEDSNGEPIIIEAFRHRNHTTVAWEDITVSENVTTTLSSIAEQINELLGNGEN
jgi:hypothetical protein